MSASKKERGDEKKKSAIPNVTPVPVSDKICPHKSAAVDEILKKLEAEDDRKTECGAW